VNEGGTPRWDAAHPDFAAMVAYRRWCQSALDGDQRHVLSMVVLGVAINVWQSYRSQQAADQLRASVNPTATVLRDGAWQETPLRNVVPSDVFRLSAGDRIPADARLGESRDLSVQQSTLIGESLPAAKAAAAYDPLQAHEPHRSVGMILRLVGEIPQS
jgi:P-type E1-E2 ATPase